METYKNALSVYTLAVFIGLIGLIFRISREALPEPDSGSVFSVDEIQKRELDIIPRKPSKGVDDPPEAEIWKTMGAHTGLFVPMSYAAWMDGRTGKSERYPCEGKAKFGEITGTVDVANRKLGTDTLVTCFSLSLIAKAGAIEVHLQSGICIYLNDPMVKENNEKDKVTTENLKKAKKNLMKDHGKELGKYIMVAMMDPRAKGRM
ncbi:hypothetical protein BCR34DRAFT_603986 [Clohesyomyces aquaticus]|uniref:Uncharacterized protein n=1 Tax=Clohesyomyces aquaticus TaxID=1231657 RepID=A0A1Y1ZAF3_9PLEO|nr:hypothetical protein BCR34DRAFT_603986 [Clohesyomyces aquaticus]